MSPTVSTTLKIITSHLYSTDLISQNLTWISISDETVPSMYSKEISLHVQQIDVPTFLLFMNEKPESFGWHFIDVHT